MIGNELLDKHCQPFGLTFKNISDILYHTQGFIAGSFALSVYLNEKFPEQDIDIYIRTQYTKVLDENESRKYKISCYTVKADNPLLCHSFEFLAQRYINDVLTSCGYELVDWRDNYIEEGPDTNPLHHFIKNVVEYTNGNNKKIQIITLYRCDLQFFLQLFDLNICRLALGFFKSPDPKKPVEPDFIYYSYASPQSGFRCLYDGKIDFYHNHNKYLKNEISLIKLKKMYLYNPTYPPNLPPRLIKYMKRGFTWINNKTNEIIDFQYLDKNNNIVKYSGELSTYYEDDEENPLNIVNSISSYIEKEGYKRIDYDDFLQHVYRLNINKTILQELVSKVFNPDRMLRLCNKYNLSFDDLIEMY